MRPAAGQASPAGLILAVETSCDDTSAAVVRGREVLSSIVSSQNELHAQFGGVVPEVASRRHTELVNNVVAEAMASAGVGWDDLGAVAVTAGPGLIGALLVGLATAKTDRLPPSPAADPGQPFAGTRRRRLRRRRRDTLCLPGRQRRSYLAGRRRRGSEFSPCRTHTSTTPPARPSTRVPACSASATPAARSWTSLPRRSQGCVRFPRAVPHGPDFSYSGLKTALLYHLRDRDEADRRAPRRHRRQVPGGDRPTAR